MTLYSLTFVLAFLPLSAAFYRVLPQKLRVSALCAVNLLFYFFACGNSFFILPLLSAAVYFISMFNGKAYVLCLALLVPLRLCGIYEIGISFFILRAAAYAFDGVREKNFFKVFAFLMFFPAVHAGPIARYNDFCVGFSKRADDRDTAQGIIRFLGGGVKKLFLADSLYALFSSMHSGATSLSATLALFAYALYIYFDFSGCADMAIGAAKVFGFALPENFDMPYMSRSVCEFFRRWHMSFANLLRDLIYIPLGGNRHGKARTLFSMFAVWILSALWHGFALPFLLWGIFLFSVCAAEKNILPKRFKIGRLCTTAVVLLSWVLFFSPTVKDAYMFYARLFCLDNILLYTRADVYYLLHNAPLMLVGMFFATPIPQRLFDALCKRMSGALYITAIPLALIMLSCILASGHIPFLYASF